jgi:ABC-type multidrug transport system ATPase subunit
MGASGAGKTSLLNILAGRARTRGRIRIQANVRLEQYRVDPTQVRKSIAFVAQDIYLMSPATPRESIRFSAKLHLPRSTTDDKLHGTLNGRKLLEQHSKKVL